MAVQKIFEKRETLATCASFFFLHKSIAMIFVSPTKAKNSRIYGGFYTKILVYLGIKKRRF